MHNYHRNIFETEENAEKIFEILKTIACNLGHVTRCEYNSLCGFDSVSEDNEYMWTADALNRACVARCIDGWSIVLPDSERVNSDQKMRTYNPCGYRVKPSNKPPYEPLYITINTSDLEDPDEVIHKAFKFAYDIKDRIVNISIM